jgi:hypothetical protein
MFCLYLLIMLALHSINLWCFRASHQSTYTYSRRAIAEHPLEAIGKMLFPVSADHGLANHLIVVSTDVWTTLLDLQHQSLHRQQSRTCSIPGQFNQLILVIEKIQEKLLTYEICSGCYSSILQALVLLLNEKRKEKRRLPFYWPLDT